MQIQKFDKTMQEQVIVFMEQCFAALGWGYDPNGRHKDIADIELNYMQSGCFWCLFENDSLIGTVAVRCIDEENQVLELKRMFVLPKEQGKGYGNDLLRTALAYAKQLHYNSICLDTRYELTKAQHLYRKHGFLEIEKYNQNEHADIYFELKLN